MALEPQEEAATPFTWGAGGARLTPDEIAQRRRDAAVLMQQGTGVVFAPGTRGAGVWTQGIAHVAKALVGGMYAHDADVASKANADENKAMIASLLSGGGAAPVATAARSAAVSPAAPAAVDTTGKIYNNNEPSPLDPPSGADRDALIRTVYGEAANEPTAGQQAVASVIRNRAVDGGYGGDTPTAVVRAPNQFEPWNGGPALARMQALSPDDPRYGAISKVVDAAYGTGGRAPEDPTEGMTHFYSPAGQAALGRSAPPWAGGESVTIGGHVFNAPDDAAAKPVQVADASGAIPASVAAAPAPAVAKVASGLGAVNPAVLQAVTSPYASPATKQIATLLLQQQMTPKDVHTQETDAKGNVWDVNRLTGQRTVALKTDAETPKFTSYKRGDGTEVPGFAADGKFTPLNPAATAPSPGDGLTGQAYLDAIDPARAGILKQMNEGRMAPPTLAALRSDKVMKLIEDASKAYPGFDATVWKRRFDTASDFSSKGKSGQSVTSLNTVYGHLGDLAEKAQALDNVDGIPMINNYVNDAKNAYASGSGGDKVNNFNLARNAVADELSKVFKGAGISDHEIEQWKGTINSSQSPTTLKGAVKTALGLVESRIAALNNSRDAGMDTNTNPRELLNQHSKDTLANVQKWIDGTVPAAAPAAAAPPAALAKLTQNPTPEMKAHFDEVFGAGAADRALGGGK